MRSASRIAAQIRRQTELDLDRMADEITAQYLNREFQCQTVPIEKRGPKVRRVPQTALIAYAAQRKILKREVLSLIHWRVEHPEKDTQDLNSIMEFVESNLLANVPQGDGCTPSRY